MGIHEFVSEIIEQNKDTLVDVSNQVWRFAETGFQEKKSA